VTVEVVITLTPDSPRWVGMDPEAVAAAAREAVDALLYWPTLRGRGFRLAAVEALTPVEAPR
jgi:hypothetical protein